MSRRPPAYEWAEEVVEDPPDPPGPISAEAFDRAAGIVLRVFGIPMVRPRGALHATVDPVRMIDRALAAMVLALVIEAGMRLGAVSESP